VWKENTEIEIIDPGLGHWGFRTDVSGAPGGGKSSMVPAVTVDRLMKDHGLAGFDLVKVNIEGAEKELFEDASAWIDQVGVLIVALHDRFRPGCSEVVHKAVSGFTSRFVSGEHSFLRKEPLCMKRNAPIRGSPPPKTRLRDCGRCQ